MKFALLKLPQLFWRFFSSFYSRETTNKELATPRSGDPAPSHGRVKALNQAPPRTAKAANLHAPSNVRRRVGTCLINRNRKETNLLNKGNYVREITANKHPLISCTYFISIMPIFDRSSRNLILPSDFVRMSDSCTSVQMNSTSACRSSMHHRMK